MFSFGTNRMIVVCVIVLELMTLRCFSVRISHVPKSIVYDGSRIIVCNGLEENLRRSTVLEASVLFVQSLGRLIVCPDIQQLIVMNTFRSVSYNQLMLMMRWRFKIVVTMRRGRRRSEMEDRYSMLVTFDLIYEEDPVKTKRKIIPSQDTGRAH